MAKQKKYQDFGFTLQIQNNTATIQQLNILGNPANLLDTANATTEYLWDISSITTNSTITLEYKANGDPTFKIFTAYVSGGADSIVAALNGLGIGYFTAPTIGGITTLNTYNDNYVFGNITVTTPQFTLTFNSSGLPISFTIGSTDFFVASVSWGDGSVDNFSGANTYVPTHTYAVGTFTATVDISSATLDFLNIGFDTIPLTSFDFSSLTSLAQVAFKSTLTNFNPTGGFQNTTELDFINSTLLSYNPALQMPNLQTLLIDNDPALTSFNPTVPMPSLNNLILQNNGLTSFNSAIIPTIFPQFTIPGIANQRFDLSLNQLPVTDVSNILIAFNSFGLTAPFYLYLQGQTPAAPPNPAGLAAKVALQSRGCIVFTD